MQSNNPVFTRADGFNGQVNIDQMATSGQTSPGSPYQFGRQMTLDSVVQKTAISMTVVFLAAAATWIFTGEINSQAAVNQLYMFSIIGALGGLVLSLVNSFKKVISPALVLLYAAFEGVFVGAFSKSVENFIAVEQAVVVPAVMGTFAAVGGTLAAYKFLNIRVSNKFRKWVTGALIGFFALSLLSFVLSFFGKGFGFNGFGTLGLITSVVGLGLGVLMLIMDFDFVERGIAAGLPDQESWRAAFGLTVTIVWIYVQMLRLLAILRGDD